MPDIELVSRTASTITCRAVDIPDGATFIRWYSTHPSDESTFFPYAGYVSTAMSDWPYFTFDRIVLTEDGNGNPATWELFEPDTTYALKASFRDSTPSQSAIGSAVTRYFATAPAVVITSQPQDVVVVAGGTVRFTVVAEGDGLRYQWQYKTATGTSWSNNTVSSATTAALSFTANTSRNGYQYRCKITASNGTTVISDAAKLTVVAETKPDSWEWESTIEQDEDFGITASEFNAFIDHIYAVAAYKKVTLSGSASTWYVTKDTPMYASQVNDVVELLDVLNPPTAVPSTVQPNTPITASFFNKLKNSLNSLL